MILGKEEAIKLFGRPTDAAKALNISRQAVTQWPDPLNPAIVDSIITALVSAGRRDEAGEIIKRYLK